MARWQSNTQERLVRAALELFSEQGYEQTTVAQIADRTGVTSRTYFRYFPDKREVLFASGVALRDAVVAGTVEALATQAPLQAILSGVVAAREVFLPRDFVQAREAVIATSEELRERELMKAASIAAGLEAALVEHGSDGATARMTAHVGVTVFLEATRRWVDGDDSPFDELVLRVAEQLRQVAAV